MIEEALRKSFAGRVATPPAVDDPAGAAIRRGRAMRQRRAVGSSAIVLVLFVGLLGGAVVARRAWLTEQAAQRGAPPAAAPSAIQVAPRAIPNEPAPTAGASPGRTVVGGSASPGLAAADPDVLVGDTLWTAGGDRVELVASNPVTAAYRVPAGWVYLAGELRLRRAGKGWLPLAPRPDGWALSGDGERLAYVANRRLIIGDLTEDGLTKRTTVEVAAGVTPVAFVGDRLVINRNGQFDFMNVDGAYTPTWLSTVVAVYGTRSGSLAGLVRSGPLVCLAELGFRPTGLTVQRLGSCGFKLAAARAAKLSPDGAWLAVPGATGVSLVDLAKSFAAGKSTGKSTGKTEKYVVACPGLATPPPTWLSGSTLATADRRGALRCHTDGSSEWARLPHGIAAGWAYVPMATDGAN